MECSTVEEQYVSGVQQNELFRFDQWLVDVQVTAKEELIVQSIAVEDQFVRAGDHLQAAIFESFGP